MNTLKIIAIVVLVVVIFISVIVINLPEDDYEIKSDRPGYDMEYTQDPIDFSYDIDVTKDNGVLSPNNKTWIDIRFYSTTILDDSLRLEDYLETQVINIKKPGVNFSFSITYFDNDVDDILTVGDSFHVHIFDRSANESYNLSSFEFWLKRNDGLIGLVDFSSPDDSGKGDEKLG
jgi:hypothetical protein